MPHESERYQYQPGDRAEVLDFLRAALPADESARAIAQWPWRFESSPMDPPRPPIIDLIRLDGQLIAMTAGYQAHLWLGGIECVGEGRGLWMVHPEHRGSKLWQRIGAYHPSDIAVIFGWSRLPVQTVVDPQWSTGPIRPLVRILDAGAVIDRLTHASPLAWMATAVGTSMGAAASLFRRAGEVSVVRLDSFDERADALWERARRATKAMIVRDRHYLNWRYCRRPDVKYLVYQAQRGSEPAGFLIARIGFEREMKWGFLIDFLAPPSSRDAFSSLIDAAAADFRAAGVAGISCFATDPAVRRTLFRRGFFPSPWSRPVHFFRRIHSTRSDLKKFSAVDKWYVTMGDGDFDMIF